MIIRGFRRIFFGSCRLCGFWLGPLAIGSDTGGSVRIPAAWNDLVGLKTTSGRLSLQGVVPLCARFDTVGPLCRSVEDAALALAALEGSKPADLTNSTLEGRRLAICDTVALDALRPEPRAAFDNAIDRLRAMGAVIERVDISQVQAALALSGVLFAAEAYGTWKDTIEANPVLMYEEILDAVSQRSGCLSARLCCGLARIRYAAPRILRGNARAMTQF